MKLKRAQEELSSDTIINSPELAENSVMRMYKTCVVVIAGLAGLGLLMWALVGPDVEGIPTRLRPYGESAFLVFPKYRSNTYSLARQSGDQLVPYPSRQAHEKGLITNAVDIHLDSRGTLWVLDSGLVRTLGKPLRKSGPKVIALDADTGEMKQTVALDGLVRGRAQFLEVEETRRDDSDEPGGPERLYISDGPGRCIAVWDVRSGRGRRLLLPRAVSHPSDVLYLALVGPSSLYFTYYKSPDMYMLDTREVASGRGLVRRVGSKPPGVVLIGREGRHILFRISGSPGNLYSWDTRSGLSRRTFLQRDSGGLGDPLHAVGDIGKTWVLEADLAGFLSGRRVTHRIRTIHRPTELRHHRGIRPTDVAPENCTTTTESTKPVTLDQIPGTTLSTPPMSTCESTTLTFSKPTTTPFTANGVSMTRTIIGDSTTPFWMSSTSTPDTTMSVIAGNLAKRILESTTTAPMQDSTTPLLLDSTTPISSGNTTNATSARNITMMSPSLESTTTATVKNSTTPTMDSRSFPTTTRPSTSTARFDPTTVQPTTESAIEATTTPQSSLTPAPATFTRSSDVKLKPSPIAA